MFGIDPFSIALIAGTALVGSIIGALAGYGTGLLLPLALVPVVGAEATVPLMAVAMLAMNGSRLVAFREAVDGRAVLIVGLAAAPMAALGALGFARLDAPAATILLGTVLMALVPARRLLKGHGARWPAPALAAAGAGFGLLSGAATGTGVLLVAILNAAGLAGTAVVATDAAISVAYGLVKVTTFQINGQLTPNLWIAGLGIGLVTVPGAFIARALAHRLSARVHATLLDAVVVVGGLAMVWRGITRL
jgi:uncharacterized membrane protein YfcA